VHPCGVSGPLERYPAGIPALDGGCDSPAMRIGVLAPLEVDERNAPLGSRDRIVLTALAIRPGELLTPGQLADAVWGDGDRRPGPRTSRPA
jgi:hypothetical protein